MTKQFEREERYLVIKLSKLPDDQGEEMSRREQIYRMAHFGKALVECVVVESDWPEFEPTWAAIEARVTGSQPAYADTRALVAALEAGDQAEWLFLARTAGQTGVRYGTNKGMVEFLRVLAARSVDPTLEPKAEGH